MGGIYEPVPGEGKATFHWADYLVFGISLAISLGIGVFFSFRQKTSDDYLVGGRSLNFMPVAFSILASVLNAVFIIGVPAEIYYGGSTFVLIGVSWVIEVVVVIFIFIPTFRKMQLTSVYEYFELRYNFRPLRIVASLTFTLSMILFLSVVLYAPAFAFSEVTSIKLWIIIVACGGVCTIYTVIGGMKAVVWTDTLQVLIIFAGILTMVIKGAIDVGGASEIYDRIKEHKRFDFTQVTLHPLSNYKHKDWDPRSRHTAFTQIFGQIFVWTSVYATNQMTVQRFMSVKTKLQAQLSLFVGVAVIAEILLGLITVLSYVMFTYYQNCDPILTGRINKPDQIVPRFLMDLLGEFHGLPGLFTAAVFAAALSSISSAINSLAAVLLEDFVKPIQSMINDKEELSQRQQMWITRIISVIFGLMTIGLSFAAEHFGDNILQMPLTIWGATTSPILGAFVLGFFFFYSTGFGTLCGLVSSLVINCLLVYGGIWHTNGAGLLTEGLGITPGVCMPNFTPKLPVEPLDNHVADYIVNISYVWYGFIGFTTSVVIGLLVSIIELGCRCRTACQYGRSVNLALMYNCKEGFGSCCRCQKCVDCGLAKDSDDDTQAMTYNREDDTLEMKSRGMENKSYRDDNYERPNY